jgi:hypothetical protein
VQEVLGLFPATARSVAFPAVNPIPIKSVQNPVAED